MAASSLTLLVVVAVAVVAATYIITVITFGIETCLGQPAMKLQNSVSRSNNTNEAERQPAATKQRMREILRETMRGRDGEKTADWFLFFRPMLVTSV